MDQEKETTKTEFEPLPVITSAEDAGATMLEELSNGKGENA